MAESPFETIKRQSETIVRLQAKNEKLCAIVQELIDGLMGNLSDADGIADRARKLLKS